MGPHKFLNAMYWIDHLYNRQPRIRQVVMRLLFREETKPVMLLGKKLSINTIRENGYFRAYNMCQKGSLLRDEVPVIFNLYLLLSKADSFIDVGANVGLFSSMMSQYKKVSSNFEVYAFEANSETYGRLKENAKENNFKSYNIGISDRECELEFVDGPVSHVFTTIDSSCDYNFKNKTLKVQCKRLDQFEVQGNSIILKIDVEGQELSVLKGASSLFESGRVKAVYLDGFDNQEEVLNFLTKYNFSFWDGRKFSKTDGKVFSLLAISQTFFEELSS
jgi:FkbM family methyltransferase